MGFTSIPVWSPDLDAGLVRPPSSEILQITVNYNVSLRKMAEMTKPDGGHGHFNRKLFPKRGGKGIVRVQCYPFMPRKEMATEEEVLRIHAYMGSRPAVVEELLTFYMTYPSRPWFRDSYTTLWALGSTVVPRGDPQCCPEDKKVIPGIRRQKRGKKPWLRLGFVNPDPDFPWSFPLDAFLAVLTKD